MSDSFNERASTSSAAEDAFVEPFAPSCRNAIIAALGHSDRQMWNKASVPNADEAPFFEMMVRNPTDPAPRLIFADWLEERGDKRGELIRTQEVLREFGAAQPANRPAVEKRLHSLLKAGVPPAQPFATNSIGMDFAFIFPGEFLMGSPDGEMGRFILEPQTQVSITNGFWMAHHTVTQGHWNAIMAESPWERRNCLFDVNRPACFVDQASAIAYCRQLTALEHQLGALAANWEYRLPSEAEWEFACRAGTSSMFSFGNAPRDIRDYAWLFDFKAIRHQEHPSCVGERRSNPWGLYDMHGNVFEWCRDRFQRRLPRRINPLVEGDPSEHAVSRGGSFICYEYFCTSGYRAETPSDSQQRDIGFRPVLAPTPV